MKNPRLIIVQTGTTTLHGDYPAWFEKALGFAMPVVRAHQGEKLDPQRHRPEGIIVTGSPLSVTERAPWMLRLGDDLLRIGARGVPVLGVCFGHQLLARAAGGDVVLNPRGREIGTVRVQLTLAGRRDPLFAWVGAASVPQPEGGGTVIDAPPQPDQIEVQATHVDAVDPLPPGAVILASNENSTAQAYRLSETVAAVQFHPELWAEAMRDLITSRRDKLQAEGMDATALAEQVHEVRAGEILRAFAEQARST
jgi:GMP synthase (glutamine-hydrolysing)